MAGSSGTASADGAAATSRDVIKTATLREIVEAVPVAPNVKRMGADRCAVLFSSLQLHGWLEDFPCYIWTLECGKWTQCVEGNHRLGALRHYRQWLFEVPVLEVPWMEDWRTHQKKRAAQKDGSPKQDE